MSSDLDLSVALTEIETAWNAFLAAVSAVPTGEGMKSAGGWTIAQIVAHVGYWDGHEANHLPERIAGTEYDWQALNDKDAQATKSISLLDATQRAVSNHAKLLAALKKTPGISAADARELTIDHYQEHEREIRAILASVQG